MYHTVTALIEGAPITMPDTTTAIVPSGPMSLSAALLRAETLGRLPADAWPALHGARCEGEQVRGTTAHLHALLQLRYQPQLAALLEAE